MPYAGLQSCNSIHQQICREREKVANFSTRQTAIAQKFYTLITKLYTYDNDKNIDNNNSEGFLKIQVRQQNTNLPYGVSS